MSVAAGAMSVLAPILGPHLVHEHTMELVAPAGFPGILVVCRCGEWRHAIPMSRAMYPGAWIEELIEEITKHGRAVVAAFRPTLAELAEWGWFHAESGA